MKKLLILMSIVTISISLLVIQLRSNETIQSEESFEEKSEPLETNESIDNLSSISSYKDFTIEDYIYDIPKELIYGMSDEELKNNITILDIENYYAFYESYNIENYPSNFKEDLCGESDGFGSINPYGSLTIAVFIDEKGEHLIATEARKCIGPCCDQTLNFLKKENETYSNVTNDYNLKIDHSKIQSDYTNAQPLIVLPQYGTTIRVEDNNIDPLTGKSIIYYDILWKNGEFITKQ